MTDTTTHDEKRARELAEDIRDVWPAALRIIDAHEQRADVEALERMFRQLSKVIYDAQPLPTIEGD